MPRRGSIATDQTAGMLTDSRVFLAARSRPDGERLLLLTKLKLEW
jgi:hypothetical protein